MSRAGDLRNVTATGTSSEDNYVLTYDDATKKVSLEVAQGGDVVNDTTPQLGGNLDLNSNDITGTGNINITGTLDLSGTADIGLIEIKSGGGNQMIIENAYASGIQIRGNWLRFQKPNTNTDMLVAKPDGEVELYYNGSQKLETTNTGVTVTGTLTASALYSTDFAEIRADDAEIYLTNAANSKYFRIKRDGDDIDFDIWNGSSTSTKIKLTEAGTLEGASDAEIKTSPIRIHSNTISTNTTVASTENAVSGGPVTIADGVTVQVDGDWTVV